MPTASNFEKFKRDFIDGCNEIAGEILEGKRIIECIIDDEHRIVLDKKGRWIKAYTYDLNLGSSRLVLFDIPKEVIAKHDRAFSIETENGYISIRRRGAIFVFDVKYNLEQLLDKH